MKSGRTERGIASFEEYDGYSMVVVDAVPVLHSNRLPVTDMYDCLNVTVDRHTHVRDGVDL